MKKRELGLVFILTAMVILSSCGGKEGEKSALGAEDTGNEVTLTVGEKMQINLEANPTTGYEWEVAEVDEKVLRETGTVYKPDSDSSDMVGNGGKEILTFEAVGAGKTTLRLIYHQPWDEAPPAETFLVTVIVK